MIEPHPHSHFLLLLLPFFFIALPAASNDSTYPNCPSYKCGDVPISYPFWINDSESTTQFCGYQGFGINCSPILNEIVPEIRLGGDSYHVQWIFPESRKISLVDEDVLTVRPGPDRCPRVRHRINLQTLPLNYTSHNVNITFHFGCIECPDFATEIQCFERKSCLQIMNNGTDESDWDEFSCTGDVVTTVIRDNINRILPNLSTTFGDALRLGFELEWWRMDDCDKCEESGGRCGHHNIAGFICFCSDGTTNKDYCKGTLISTIKF
ncbi:putative wall-associated receptor kinase, galacturonan-binding domain-containing protein [Helianthus annuus]|uniref:non-specific serine/threonine protein kinase n=1 Tax=Helianthus annuus TaxID=4232 RepID=A0A9K3DKL0_HELAN|nr:putative wall-associated receptor kinase, galacturonan-binding domain-containing protein [Helianthus annuus]KAJ0429878.1 putative wall-associated receptor kinase, galacturonan-binding domain-containing protein [Helianthus annuus]